MTLTDLMESLASAGLEDNVPKEAILVIKDTVDALTKLQDASRRAHDWLAGLNPSDFTGDASMLVSAGMVREALRSALDLPLDEVRQIIEARAS